MLFVLIVAFVLNLAIVESVWNKNKAWASLLQHKINARDDDEVSNEVQKCTVQQNVFAILIASEFAQLQESRDNEHEADHVGISRLKLKWNTLRDGFSQHLNRVQVKYQTRQCYCKVKNIRCRWKLVEHFAVHRRIWHKSEPDAEVNKLRTH